MCLTHIIRRTPRVTIVLDGERMKNVNVRGLMGTDEL